MRVEVDGGGELLRSALADLLRDAGHEVVAHDADLAVLLDRDARATGRTRTTLRFDPSRSSSGREVGAAGLARALEAGGVAVWGYEFDPSVLVDVLARRGGRPEKIEPLEPATAPSVLESAPDAWLGVDAGEARVVWRNAAAARLLGAPGADAEAARLAALVAPREGRERWQGFSRALAATWWTDDAGLRIVGLTDAALESPSPHWRSLAELGRTSATLAHELRNPVASFAGAVDLLAGDLPRAERVEIVALAKERVEQMRVMLDDTLRLARPLKGEAAPVDCRLLAQGAAAGVATDPRFRQSRVELDLPGERLHVRGWEQPLAQALANLLVNAAEAQGGAGPIRLIVRREGDWATIRVEDEGPGVPEALREKVFEPFWTTKTTGTGLGLAYVRRVVEACGGRARVEARRPKGAAFVLDLPVAEPPAGE